MGEKNITREGAEIIYCCYEASAGGVLGFDGIFEAGMYQDRRKNSNIVPGKRKQLVSTRCGDSGISQRQLLRAVGINMRELN